MTDHALKQEIRQVVEERLTNGDSCPSSWIVHAVVQHYPRLEGQDSDFYLLCAHGHVTTLVRQVLREYKLSKEDQTERSQLVLPGFERLQRRYLVERDGESVVVPIHSMTPDEIEAKIEELRQMQAGCAKHANELQRWLDNMPDQATN